MGISFVPLYDRILVLPQTETKTASGLYIPDSATELIRTGIVVAVGTGKQDDKGNLVPLILKVKDKIVFGRYAGSEFVLDNVTFLVLREGEVHGIVRE